VVSCILECMCELDTGVFLTDLEFILFVISTKTCHRVLLHFPVPNHLISMNGQILKENKLVLLVC